MNKPDFNKQMEQILNNLKEERVKILMHSCCAPCSSASLERIKGFADVSVYYYNPNIDGQTEFYKRSNEQKKFCDEIGVGFIPSEYNHSDFLNVAQGKENLPEGGARCYECFYLRLKKTAELAKKMGIKYFMTTLTLSPLKNATVINEIGCKVGEEVGIEYIVSEFKKKDGYLRSIELSREYELYRQNYCGCEFSKNK